MREDMEGHTGDNTGDMRWEGIVFGVVGDQSMIRMG